MRIKAMQQVVDSQASRIAALAAEKEVAALGHQDEYTGQGKEINNITTLMFSYITCKQGDDHHCQLSHFVVFPLSIQLLVRRVVVMQRESKSLPLSSRATSRR